MTDVLHLLVIENDPLLEIDLGSIAHPLVRISVASGQEALDVAGIPEWFDAIAIDLSAECGGCLLDSLVQRGAQPVLALVGRGPPGRSLESALLLAEARGAAAALPKPIDAIELIYQMMVTVVKKRTHPSPVLSEVIADLAHGR